MGMYDYLAFDEKPQEIPLIVGEWQTSDLVCRMNNYRVTKEGKLLERSWYLESNEDAPKEKSNKLSDFHKYLKTRYTDWAEQEYHGDIFIIGDLDGKFHNFVEFRLRFTHGKLEAITPCA